MIGEPIIAIIIVTLGLSSMLRGLVFFVASTEVRRFPDGIFPIAPVQLGPVLMPQIYAWALAIAAAGRRGPDRLLPLLAPRHRPARSGRRPAGGDVDGHPHLVDVRA